MEDAEILALFQARSVEAIRELERKYGRAELAPMDDTLEENAYRYMEQRLRKQP